MPRENLVYDPQNFEVISRDTFSIKKIDFILGNES
jgi:hypothetical protein